MIRKSSASRTVQRLMDREPEQSIRLPQPTERKTASGYHGPARVENAFFR